MQSTSQPKPGSFDSTLALMAKKYYGLARKLGNRATKAGGKSEESW